MAKDEKRDAPEFPQSGEYITSLPGHTPGPPGTNPFSHEREGATGGTGGVNPSAPTTGTEGWGLGSKEDSTTGEGQGRLGSQTPHNPSVSSEVTFRCSEVNPQCDWTVQGRSAGELRSKIEEHARERHNLHDFSEEMWNRFKALIRREAA